MTSLTTSYSCCTTFWAQNKWEQWKVLHPSMKKMFLRTRLLSVQPSLFNSKIVYGLLDPQNTVSWRSVLLVRSLVSYPSILTTTTTTIKYSERSPHAKIILWRHDDFYRNNCSVAASPSNECQPLHPPTLCIPLVPHQMYVPRMCVQMNAKDQLMRLYIKRRDAHRQAVILYRDPSGTQHPPQSVSLSFARATHRHRVPN